MKKRILRNRKGIEISSTLVEWIFAILLLVVLLFIIYALKGKQFSILDRLKQILFFR